MDDKLTEKQVENLIIKSRQCGRTFQAFLKAIAESGKKCIEEFENFEKYKNFTFADIENEPPEIIKCSQCGCFWPAGHNYCPECAKPLLNDDESIDPDTKCAECDHPDECEICLSAFEASRTRKEIAVTARIFSANVKLEEENAALKKLFIAEHREKNDLLKSIALHRGREKDLLNKITELKILCSSEEIMNLRLDLSEALIKITTLESINGK